MQKLKKITVIITLIVVLLTSFGQNGVLALTQQEAGNALVNTARNYMNTYGAETEYLVGIRSNFSAAAACRAKTVFDQQKSSYLNYGEAYWLDCASFVQLVCIRGINLGKIYSQINDRSGNYVGFNPNTAMSDEVDTPPFERVQGDISNVQVGDIIFNTHHVMIYAGNGNVIHCDGNGANNNGRGAISYQPLSEYAANWQESTSSYHVYRISKEAAAQLDAEDTLPPVIDEIINVIKDWIYERVPFREVNESSIDKDKTFAYQGIAKLESQTTSDDDTAAGTNDEPWRFPKLSDLLTWILNFMFTTIKSIIVGMTTIVQILITYYLDAATGEDVSDRLADGMIAYLENGLNEDIKDSVTMEKIVYNLVPLFDVDVFNGNQAGGETLDDSSLVMIIRNLVATIYMAIRQVSIIGLLIVLIYIGIRLATTTVSEQKAEYKKKLVSWGIAFFIVFGMHYFLVFVMKINEILVDILRNIGTNLASSISGGAYFDLAQAMRELTYLPDIAKSAVAMVMYMVMIYYLIKFILIYFKRLFITIILIILGPFIGIKYAVDKIRFNKSSSLSTWGKEYIFSVGTQTIHALVYTIFIGITYKIVLTSDVAQMAVCMLAFLFFRFMTTAETLLRGMLKLTGNSAKNIIGDVDSTDIKDLFGLGYIMNRVNVFYKKEYIPKFAKNKYQAGKRFFKDHLESEYIKIRRREYIDKYEDAYMPDERRRKAYVQSNIDKEIDELIRKEFNDKLNKTLGTLGTVPKFAKAGMKFTVGTTMAAVGPFFVGTAQAYTGAKTIASILGAPIRGYRRPSKIAKYRGKNETYKQLSAWIAANGTQEVATSLKKDYLYQKDEITAQNELRVTTLHQARRVELELEQEIANQKQTLLKGAEPDATPLERELSKKYTKELRQNVEDSMKTVDRKDIHKEVKNYMKKNNKYALTFKDFENIAERFDIKVSGEIVDEKVQTEEFIENVKSETMARFIREVTENDGIAKEIAIDSEAIDKVEENVKNKLESANEEEKSGLSLTLKCLDDKKHELEGREKLHVYSNLSDEEKQKVNAVLAEATTDEVIEKQVQKLSREQIVNTMKKAVNMEGSIKKNEVIKEFKPVIEKVEKLRDLDEIARETGEQTVYKNAGEIVETMIKNTKITNRETEN